MLALVSAAAVKGLFGDSAFNTGRHPSGDCGNNTASLFSPSRVASFANDTQDLHILTSAGINAQIQICLIPKTD